MFAVGFTQLDYKSMRLVVLIGMIARDCVSRACRLMTRIFIVNTQQRENCSSILLGGSTLGKL